jgi:nitroreductase
VELDEALYTTRAMRRVRPDPVPASAVAAMLDAAIRAPSGGNSQNWRFLTVTDPAIKAILGPAYRRAFEQLEKTVYAQAWERARRENDEEALRVRSSSAWLAENFEAVPLWLLAFGRNDPSGASIYPAVWSAMLSARGHGLGTCLTTILGLFESKVVFETLGVPEDKGWELKAAVSCGYPVGRWAVAERAPAHRVAYSERWGRSLDFEIPQPLWP